MQQNKNNPEKPMISQDSIGSYMVHFWDFGSIGPRRPWPWQFLAAASARVLWPRVFHGVAHFRHRFKINAPYIKWFMRSSWFTQFYVLCTQLTDHWIIRSINHLISPMGEWCINWSICQLVNQFNVFSIDPVIKPMAWGFKKPRTWRGLGQARPSLGPQNLSMASHSWSSFKKW